MSVQNDIQKYNYEHKKTIGDKLSKIIDKPYMEEIIKIIKNNNDEKCITENISQGTYIKINYLSNKACYDIEKYLENIVYKKEIYTPISIDFNHYSSINDNINNVRLSTKEKSLIIREKYTK